VLVVEADPETRIARLVQRGLTAEDARARIAVQATDEERRAIADVVLDNSGTPEDLAAQVETFWAERVAAR
jgi:dephospho-CoA kinase